MRTQLKKYIVSIDQGTTSCRALVFDPDGNIIGLTQREFSQHFPHPDWVEHDPVEILSVQIDCIKGAVTLSKIAPEEIACVAITNQRETTVVWNRKTLKPLYNAIVWQCRRTKELADKLKEQADLIRAKTGLIPDSYFSGPKIRWLLDNVPQARSQANNGELAFGTIDSWLIANLSEEGNHLTEPSNASRTMLFNIEALDWDNELLELLGVPANMMPKVVPSNSNFGSTRKDLLGFSAPILAVLGDQQAALFGQCCFEPGMLKCTYGTGSFILGNIGTKIRNVKGLLTTIAWQLIGEKTIYAFEGANFTAGAAIQWLRDNLHLIESSADCEDLANSIDSNEGVYFIPAFVGLGSPWWNSDIRGAIVGLTRSSGKAHFVRAALEAIAYQVKDIQEEITQADLPMSELRVDGGVSNNEFMLQFQADLLGIPVKRAVEIEATAWGVAALGAITAGLTTVDQISKAWRCGLNVEPKTDRSAEYKGWQAALADMLGAIKPGHVDDQCVR
jgi:glycerol kinase